MSYQQSFTALTVDQHRAELFDPKRLRKGSSCECCGQVASATERGDWAGVQGGLKALVESQVAYAALALELARESAASRKDWGKTNWGSVV